MGKLFHSEKINLPDAESLGIGKTHSLPFFLVGDEAFPLKPWLQRPYPGKGISEEKVIFHYRLSRARRVIKNASAYSQQDREFTYLYSNQC